MRKQSDVRELPDTNMAIHPTVKIQRAIGRSVWVFQHQQCIMEGTGTKLLGAVSSCSRSSPGTYHTYQDHFLFSSSPLTTQTLMPSETPKIKQSTPSLSALALSPPRHNEAEPCRETTSLSLSGGIQSSYSL